jgi:DNA-binding response OmpR family regulator
MLRTGKVFKRTDLLRELWPARRVPNLRVVDVSIRRLRAKLGTASRYIRTVKNVGYGFVVPRGL